MRARCTRFAAAWVVVGCSASPPRVAPSPEPPADAAGVALAIAPLDASPPDAVPIDAAPPDAYIDPCSLPFDPQHPVYCNPPMPGYVLGKIVDVAVQGAGVIVTISAGSDDGVAPDWTGDLIDERDIPVRGGQLVITSVRSRSCVAKIKLTRDQVAASSLRVRLAPPGY